MNQIGTLASNIWDNEFGDANSEIEREMEIEGISGHLETSAIGQMNILINTSFGFVSGDADPELRNEEKAILTQIYLKDWYKKQSRNILRGIGVSSYSSSKTSLTEEGSSVTESSFSTLMDDWTTIREGDTTITRSRATSSNVGGSSFSTVSNDSARMLKQLSEESELKLLDLVSRYNLYQAEPAQVVGKDFNTEE